jgi:hypothetical protein
MLASVTHGTQLWHAGLIHGVQGGVQVLGLMGGLWGHELLTAQTHLFPSVNFSGALYPAMASTTLSTPSMLRRWTRVHTQTHTHPQPVKGEHTHLQPVKGEQTIPSRTHCDSASVAKLQRHLTNS